MKTQDMNLAPDRQGYLGNLSKKTVIELKELLERQEKILLKRKFLNSLPDKGEKTRVFAVYLKQLIEQRSSDSSTSAAFTGLKTEVTKLGQKSHPVENISASVLSDDISDNDFKDTVRSLDFRDTVSNKDTHDVVISRNDINVDVQSEIENSNVLSDNNQATMLENSTILISSLEKMTLGSKNKPVQAETEHYINSYERVINRVEATSLYKRPKFLPNRTLRDDHIPTSPYPHDTRPKKTDRIEESAANPPVYKFQESKLISVQESLKLIEQQIALNEELITQRSARKWADHLASKMDIYSPANVDMQYRETDGAYQDSDDDNDDADANQEDEY